MVSRGKDKLANADADLECPACRYCLRGLRGDPVTCPECGLHCDRSRLIAELWRGSLRAVPGYARLITPPAWLFIFLLLVVFISAVERGLTERPTPGMVTCIAAAAAITIWFILNLRVWWRYPLVRGGLMIAFAHVIVTGYMVGVIGAFFCIAVALDLLPALSGILWLLGAPLFVGLMVACYHLERLLALLCIRAELLRRATHSLDA